MKKIFMTMLLVLIPLNVQATSNQITFSDKQLCRYYKEEKVFTDYIIEGENTNEYPFKSNDKITKEYQTTTKPVEKPNRVILSEDVSYSYGKVKKVNRIVIRFEGEPLLYQLEIYEKNDDLEYTFSNYNAKTYPSIKDDDLEHFEKILSNTLDIILPHEVDPFDITIKLYMDQENEFTMFSYFYPKEMTQRYEEGNLFYENYYIKNTNDVLLENMVFDDEGRIAMKKITNSLDDVKTYRYEGDLITKEPINDGSYYKIPNIKYTYQDTLFKYYKIQKKYKDGYYSSLEGYIKDDSKCINKYQQQSNLIKTTNKIINNNLNNKITSKQEDIEKDIVQEQGEQEEQEMDIDSLENEEDVDINKESNLSYKESKVRTKNNKIIYILPVIILSIIFLLGYLLYNLLKER